MSDRVIFLTSLPFKMSLDQPHETYVWFMKVKKKIALTLSIYKYHSIYMNQFLTLRACQQHFVQIKQEIFSLRLTSI